jgi:hypothetical protein
MEDKAKDAVVHYYTKIVITKLIVKYFSQEVNMSILTALYLNKNCRIIILLGINFFLHYFWAIQLKFWRLGEKGKVLPLK